MRMKLSAFIFISVGIMVLTASCGSHRSEVVHVTDVLKVDTTVLNEGASDTLRLGRMRQGEKVVKRLRIENGCGKPLVIVRHSTTCGCVVPEYERRPIPADGSTDIVFTFDSQGEYGWQMKLLDFYLSSSARPLKIYVEAEVE